MHIKQACALALAASLSSSFCSTALGSPATLRDISDSMTTTASDADGMGATTITTAPALPLNDMVTATDGDAENITTYSFRETRNAAIFDFDLDHTRGADNGSFTQSIGSLTFLVDEDTDPVFYDLSGLYSTTGLNIVQMLVSLRDVDTGIIFSESHTSNSTTNEKFVIGGGDLQGDSANNTTGNPTGQLLDGHTYRLNYSYFIDNFELGTVGKASAFGNISLTVTTDIPTPSASILLTTAIALTRLPRTRQVR